MSGVPPSLRQGHGTEARARRHYREGGKPCPACADAYNANRREREARRRSIRKTDARAA